MYINTIISNDITLNNNNIIIVDNENPLVDLPTDEIHRPQTRSLTKPSNSKPVTLIHAVPKLDIPSDEL